MKFRWRRCFVVVAITTLLIIAIVPNFLHLLRWDRSRRRHRVLYFEPSSIMNMNGCVKTSDVFNLRESVIEIAKALKRAKSHARGVKSDAYLKMAMTEMGTLLETLQIQPDDVQVNQESEPKSVCPETYKGTTYGYPYFYKGFEIEHCSYNKSISSLVTIVMAKSDNISKEEWGSYQNIIKQISRTYGNVSTIIGIKRPLLSKDDLKRLPDFVTLKSFSSYATLGKMLNILLKQVKTNFTLIAQDLIHFTDDVRLERLIREIERLNVAVAGGASRDQNGRWRPGCYQRGFRNFSFVLEEGYDESLHECVFCDHIDSPFMIKTEIAKAILFDETITGLGVLEDFFVRIGQRGHSTVVCPDSMFYVNKTLQNNETMWHSFAKKWNIHNIRKSPDVHVTFSCANYKGGCDKGAGYALHPCCLQDLSDLIKFILQYCDSRNIICELQEGTLLGAVKFGKVLPWERDGDLTFLTANYSVLKDIAPSAAKTGYSFHDEGGIWCCVDNRTAGGVIHMSSRHWQVQMYGQHLMDSELLQMDGMTPTTMLFDGQWVKVPRNPGLHARNRYGHEIYAHAEHWMSLGKKTGWINYKTREFTECKEQNKHDCLDQFNGDGNIQFKNVLP